MKKIALIIPYYGKFPNYFQLFLNSCKCNPTIDWLLFTDIEDTYDYPHNVHLIKKSFYEIRALFQSKFDFPIVLETPYKLCDYRPAYGYLFDQYLDNYNFWGYCDIDLLFGDLRTFLPDSELEKYDKIGHLGHLSIYRNEPNINTLFKKEIDGRFRYKEVFTTPYSCIFDEWDDISINKIFLLAGKRLWIWNNFFDAYPNDDNLVKVTMEIDLQDFSNHPRISRKSTFISWENGKIFAWTRHRIRWEKEECAYVHLQKRAMRVDCADNESRILCLPDKFMPLNSGISLGHVVSSMIHQIFNRKRFLQAYRTAKYALIVKTAPIRHKFRKH